MWLFWNFHCHTQKKNQIPTDFLNYNIHILHNCINWKIYFFQDQIYWLPLAIQELCPRISLLCNDGWKYKPKGRGSKTTRKYLTKYFSGTLSMSCPSYSSSWYQSSSWPSFTSPWWGSSGRRGRATSGSQPTDKMGRMDNLRTIISRLLECWVNIVFFH